MESHDEEGTISLPPSPDPFEDLAVRHLFVRKVISVVAAQLLAIIAIASFTMLVDDVRAFIADDNNHNLTMGVLATSVLIYLLTGLWISCKPRLMKEQPKNIIFLCVITGSLAIMTSIACVIFKSGILIMIVVILMSSCVGIFVFTFNKNIYVHSWRSFAFVFLWGLISCACLIPLKNSEFSSKIMAGGLTVLLVYAPVLHLHYLIIVAPETGMTADDYFLGALEVLSFCLCPCFCLDERSSEQDRSSPYVLIIPEGTESDTQDRLRAYEQGRLPNMFLEEEYCGEPPDAASAMDAEDERSSSGALISQEDESDSQDRIAVLDPRVRDDFFNADFIDDPPETEPVLPGSMDNV